MSQVLTKPRTYNLSSEINCDTPKEKHNNPLENYHIVAQEHNRLHGSNINRSDRLTEFHWSKINISQTKPRERKLKQHQNLHIQIFYYKILVQQKLISVCTHAATPIPSM